jgi:hypothetical protein
MSFFSRAEQISAEVKESATELLTKIFGADAVSGFETEIETIFRSDVIVLFEDAVTAADSLIIPGTDGEAGTPATGTQKRDAAFAQLAKDLESKGISLGESVVNLGIELVVGLLKAKTPATA